MSAEGIVPVTREEVKVHDDGYACNLTKKREDNPTTLQK